jgi:hypothetical protein
MKIKTHKSLILLVVYTWVENFVPYSEGKKIYSKCSDGNGVDKNWI